MFVSADPAESGYTIVGHNCASGPFIDVVCRDGRVTFLGTSEQLIRLGFEIERRARELAGAACESSVGGEPTSDGPATPIIACKPHPAELVALEELG